MRRTRAVAILLGFGVALLPSAAGGADEAERQYRAARRLAADAAPGAAAALDEVIRLAPDGPLVDDALVDAARLEPLPERPESIGALGFDEARRALERLDRAVVERPAADRIAEARYLRALVRLEPLPGYDAASARRDLTVVATARPASRWSVAARHALGWLGERMGQVESGRAALQRVLVDHPRDSVAPWSALAAARIELRDGRPGRAALLAQQALDGGVGAARALREAAVRELVGPSREGAPPPRVPLDVRSVTDAAATPGGALVVIDRRRGEVVRHAANGPVERRWSLEDPRAVAGNGRGLIVVAAGDFLWKLESRGDPTRLASLGSWSPVGDIAVDTEGTIWLLDRRGEEIGVVRPGAGGVTPWTDTGGRRLTAIEWDGRRLVAIARDEGIVEVAADGSITSGTPGGTGRFDALAVGPAGGVVVLGRRHAQLTDLGAPASRALVDLHRLGVERPRTVVAGADGVLHVIDDEGPAWLRLP